MWDFLLLTFFSISYGQLVPPPVSDFTPLSVSICESVCASECQNQIPGSQISLNRCPGICICQDTCFEYGVRYPEGYQLQKDTCNTCTCINGQFVCTDLNCPTSFDTCRYEGKTYFEGDKIKVNCNECTCMNTQFVCTNLICNDPPVPFPEQCEYNGTLYANGVIYKMDCNTCVCRDGVSYCTKMECPFSPKEQCEYNGTLYANGVIYKMDCNTCVCRDGVSYCTKMACPFPPKEQCEYNGTLYANGVIYKMDCNTCVCRDGVSYCTKMKCSFTPIIAPQISGNCTQGIQCINQTSFSLDNITICCTSPNQNVFVNRYDDNYYCRCA